MSCRSSSPFPEYSSQQLIVLLSIPSFGIKLTSNSLPSSPLGSPLISFLWKSPLSWGSSPLSVLLCHYYYIQTIVCPPPPHPHLCVLFSWLLLKASWDCPPRLPAIHCGQKKSLVFPYIVRVSTMLPFVQDLRHLSLTKFQWLIVPHLLGSHPNSLLPMTQLNIDLLFLPVI